MKKVTVIVLLMCLVLPLTATFTWLHYQKRLVRKEVKRQLLAGIDRKELVLLKFSRKQAAKLRWEHEREFEYGEEMYDVVESETSGDTVYYWCWWDHEETKLNKQLSKLTARIWNNHPETGKTQHQLLVFFKSLYHNHPPQWHAIHNPTLKPGIDYLMKMYTSLSFPPPIPPPMVKQS